jgi:hypothetical protein
MSRAPKLDWPKSETYLSRGEACLALGEQCLAFGEHASPRHASGCFLQCSDLGDHPCAHYS